MPRSFGVVFLIALVFWALVGLFAGEALGNHVQCGGVIVQDTTLDSDLVDCPGDGIVIGADGVTLDLGGHTVDGDGDPDGARRCDTGIANGSFDDCGPYAVGHSGVTIQNGTVREFAHGVQVVETDRSTLLRLRLEGNTGFGGIATYLASNGRIEGNRAIGNNSAGIAVYEPSGRTTIVRNVLARNRLGLELAGGSPGDRVEENVAYGNGAAFLVVWATGVRVTGNRVSDNASGLTIFEGIGNRIERNHVRGNHGTGLSVGGRRNWVERNAVVHNGGAGIGLDEGADNVVVRNASVRNRGDGVAVGSSLAIERLLVHSNRVMRNGDDGIDVDSADVTLSRNDATFNGDLGIEAVAGVTDGGANRAFGNGNPLQCLNVSCR